MEIALAVRHDQDGLECEYRGVNHAGVPILVFDRLYSMASRKMETGWFYARVQGSQVELSRALFQLPPGLHHENPEVPYGREVGVGETFSGHFRIPLPLRDRNPYPALTRQARVLPTSVTDLRFRLGWAPKPTNLPPAIAPVDWEGERLWLLPYRSVLNLQQLATAEQRLAAVSGESAIR